METATLVTWKDLTPEACSVLGFVVSERTVRRWRTVHADMPVAKLDPDSNQSRVYADRREFRAWLLRRRPILFRYPRK